MTSARPIAIFISFSGQGGVEKMVTNLSQGLIDKGFRVEMVIVKAQGEHISNIPDKATIVNLGAKHTISSLPALVRYIRQHKPIAMLAAKDRAIKVAVMARLLSRAKFQLVGRLGTTVSAALEGRSRLRKFTWYQSMRLFYRGVDKIVAVSQGVANDVLNITGLPVERVMVVRNPVWRPEIVKLGKQSIEHPWLQNSDVSVILGSGRLTRQKDFPTLIRAFARLRQRLNCRLIILGEGQLREQLSTLAEELGVTEHISMPGFVNNPYAYIVRSKLFVLSSAWEGSPNVLTEALALGTPVVSTDCPSGPIEILDKGRYGTLVEIGNVEAMAEAMELTLKNPLKPELLKQAVSEYTVDKSVQGYLTAMNLDPSQQ